MMDNTGNTGMQRRAGRWEMLEKTVGRLGVYGEAVADIILSEDKKYEMEYSGTGLKSKTVSS